MEKFKRENYLRKIRVFMMMTILSKLLPVSEDVANPVSWKQ